MKRFLSASVFFLLGLIVSLGLLFCVPGCSDALAQWDNGDTISGESETPASRVRAGALLLPDELSAMSPEGLRVLRNTVYARHGRSFDDEDLQKHFVAQGWYEADPSYTEDRLTVEDHKNVELLLMLEGRPAAAAEEGERAMVQQVEELSQSVGALEVLDAYLTDKECVESGTAPEGFELKPLEHYKQKGIKIPLTAPKKEEPPAPEE